MSIGETLADARASAGLTVDQVSDSTRVRASVISAIEHDDFSTCGGDFYARGHIRSIAQVVGVDPAPLIAEFDETHGDVAARSLQALQSESLKVRERRGPNWSAAMAVALVLVLGYGVFQIAATGDESGSRTQTQTNLGPDKNKPPKGPNKPPAGNPGATPTPEPSPEDPVAVAPQSGVSVRLAVVDGKSWVSVRDPSGRQLFQGLLDSGITRVFNADERLSFVIGNAGAVRLKVNGERLGRPGGFGEVVRLEFGPNGPKVA